MLKYRLKLRMWLLNNSRKSSLPCSKTQTQHYLATPKPAALFQFCTLRSQSFTQSQYFICMCTPIPIKSQRFFICCIPTCLHIPDMFNYSHKTDIFVFFWMKFTLVGRGTLWDGITHSREMVFVRVIMSLYILAQEDFMNLTCSVPLYNS